LTERRCRVRGLMEAVSEPDKKRVKAAILQVDQEVLGRVVGMR
jgi:hypothetical protein